MKNKKSSAKQKEKENNILNLLSFYLYNNDFHPTLMDGLLDVCGQASIVIEKKNELALSFEVDTPPTWAGVLTLECIRFGITVGYVVEIYEPYALVIDEKGEKVIDVLHGDEALYYQATGETPEDLEKEFKNSIKKDEEENVNPVDAQKKVDGILDQIGKKGIGSLKKSQKKFLLKYSKGDINTHNHNTNPDKKEENKDNNQDDNNENKQ